ncbi:hypothetical protein [Agromyces sp. PvR057]|uniref:hypothetical protein n=1 Tax=Agromyces sp. PvR057 TaxID=3156403 RepID=UPI0033944E3B
MTNGAAPRSAGASAASSAGRNPGSSMSVRKFASGTFEKSSAQATRASPPSPNVTRVSGARTPTVPLASFHACCRRVVVVMATSTMSAAGSVPGRSRRPCADDQTVDVPSSVLPCSSPKPLLKADVNMYQVALSVTCTVARQSLV